MNKNSSTVLMCYVKGVRSVKTYSSDFQRFFLRNAQFILETLKKIKLIKQETKVVVANRAQPG